jgi:methylenetetrahydrofolate dehydrogenase (NADP+) / methenyltetrahydrofolate cyclohydrolase
VVGAQVIDGKAIAASVRDRVRAQVSELAHTYGVRPGLATILVGDDQASEIYVRRKHEACQQVGISSFNQKLAAETSQAELAWTIQNLNADPSVHGILLQLPLPAHIDAQAMTSSIDPDKDADGLTPVNAGLTAQGRPLVAPCTPAGIMELLRASDTEVEGADAVVVGRSTLVGRPVSSLLLSSHATVTVCHSRTRDLERHCRSADILVSCVGVPKLIGGDMVAEGATVIDVGMNRSQGALCGDVDFEAVQKKARAITPVPGGVGPMTIAMLLQNTLQLATHQLGADRYSATDEP